MLTDLKDNMNKYRETRSKFEDSNDGPIRKKYITFYYFPIILLTRHYYVVHNDILVY